MKTKTLQLLELDVVKIVLATLVAIGLSMILRVDVPSMAQAQGAMADCAMTNTTTGVCRDIGPLTESECNECLGDPDSTCEWGLSCDTASNQLYFCSPNPILRDLPNIGNCYECDESGKGLNGVTCTDTLNECSATCGAAEVLYACDSSGCVQDASCDPTTLQGNNGACYKESTCNNECKVITTGYICDGAACIADTCDPNVLGPTPCFATASCDDTCDGGATQYYHCDQDTCAAVATSACTQGGGTLTCYTSSNCDNMCQVPNPTCYTCNSTTGACTGTVSSTSTCPTGSTTDQSACNNSCDQVFICYTNTCNTTTGVCDNLTTVTQSTACDNINTFDTPQDCDTACIQDNPTCYGCNGDRCASTNTLAVCGGDFPYTSSNCDNMCQVQNPTCYTCNSTTGACTGTVSSTSTCPTGSTTDQSACNNSCDQVFICYTNTCNTTTGVCNNSTTVTQSTACDNINTFDTPQDCDTACIQDNPTCYACDTSAGTCSSTTSQTSCGGAFPLTSCTNGGSMCPVPNPTCYACDASAGTCSSTTSQTSCGGLFPLSACTSGGSMCPVPVSGCIDDKANNYNQNATMDDGSCTYNGCQNEMCVSTLTSPNGPSCTNDTQCVTIVSGCMDDEANNFDATANQDDGSCTYNGCENNTCVGTLTTKPNSGCVDNTECVEVVPGCTDDTANNYNSAATQENNTCTYNGCMQNACVTTLQNPPSANNVCTTTTNCLACPNNPIDQQPGDSCDDGNTLSTGDTIQTSCGCVGVLPTCGNGELDTGEECDDGNTNEIDGCDTMCKTNVCGDGTVHWQSKSLDEMCLRIPGSTDGLMNANEKIRTILRSITLSDGALISSIDTQVRRNLHRGEGYSADGGENLVDVLSEYSNLDVYFKPWIQPTYVDGSIPLGTGPSYVCTKKSDGVWIESVDIEYFGPKDEYMCLEPVCGDEEGTCDVGELKDYDTSNACNNTWRCESSINGKMVNRNCRGVIKDTNTNTCVPDLYFELSNFCTTNRTIDLEPYVYSETCDDGANNGTPGYCSNMCDKQLGDDAAVTMTDPYTCGGDLVGEVTASDDLTIDTVTVMLIGDTDYTYTLSGSDLANNTYTLDIEYVDTSSSDYVLPGEYVVSYQVTTLEGPMYSNSYTTQITDQCDTSRPTVQFDRYTCGGDISGVIDMETTDNLEQLNIIIKQTDGSVVSTISINTDLIPADGVFDATLYYNNFVSDTYIVEYDIQFANDEKNLTGVMGVYLLTNQCNTPNGGGGGGRAGSRPIIYCGNNKIEEINMETCDDGNYINGDGCDSRCMLEGELEEATTVLTGTDIAIITSEMAVQTIDPIKPKPVPAIKPPTPSITPRPLTPPLPRIPIDEPAILPQTGANMCYELIVG